MEAVNSISAKLLDSIYNRLAITYLIHLPQKFGSHFWSDSTEHKGKAYR